MEQEFEILNTSKIQIASLKAYMKILGYEYYPIYKTFISEWWENRRRVSVSVRTAVLAHNGHFTDWHGVGFHRHSVFGDIPTVVWGFAQSTKIVHYVYLQKSYKKGILTTKHLVQFVRPEEADLLLKKK